MTAQTIVIQRSGSEKESERKEGVRERKVCALTKQSSAGLHLTRRHAPSRHTLSCLAVCAVMAQVSSAFVVCAVTAHLNRPLQAYSSPLWGPNTMLFLKLLPIDSAPSRHIRSTTSSAPSRRTDQDFAFCAITAQSTPIRALTAQLSSAILSPGLPARP